MVRRLLVGLETRAFVPVDVSSLVVLRVALGLAVLWHFEELWRHDLIRYYFVDARFQFKYPGFGWVHAWSGDGVYVHAAILATCALFVALGFLYRLSAFVLLVSQIYFFLLDQGRYVNHTYLLCLFNFLFLFLPAHRAFSIDACLWPRLRSSTVSAWTLWPLRAQMGAVYFFAGIAKVEPDWLRGEPMRTWLRHAIQLPIFPALGRLEWTPYFMSYAGMFLDLSATPLLLWRRSRPFAFAAVVVFHTLNGRMFPLDVFPWFAIAASTIFLEPDWPRRLLAGLRLSVAAVQRVPAAHSPPPAAHRVLILSFVAVYVAIQVLVPLHGRCQSGGIEWTYFEHRFSWQMMLADVETHAVFVVTDPNDGATRNVDARTYLDPLQLKHMGWRPDMVWQLSRFLGAQLPRAGPRKLQIRVELRASINGRTPTLFLDPDVDLATKVRPPLWGRPEWLLVVD